MAARATGGGTVTPWARAAALGFCLLVLLSPRSATAGARAALDAWWTLLVPALLPFLLAAEVYLWGSLDAPDGGPGVSLLARLTGLPGAATAPLVAAWVAGYPAGAALAERWVRAGRLSRDAAARLIALGSVPDPMFVAALWAPAMAHARALPFVLLAVQYVALIPVVLWLRSRPLPAEKDGLRPHRSAVAHEDPLLAAALAAGRTLLLVGAAAALVGASASGLRAVLHAGTAFVLPPWWRELAAAAVDALLLAEPALPVAGRSALVATSALAASGGLVLWLETWAITRPSGIDLRPFLQARLLQAVAAAVLAALAARLLGPGALGTAAPAVAVLAAVALPLPVSLAAGWFGLVLVTRRTVRPAP